MLIWRQELTLDIIDMATIRTPALLAELETNLSESEH